MQSLSRQYFTSWHSRFSCSSPLVQQQFRKHFNILLMKRRQTVILIFNLLKMKQSNATTSCKNVETLRRKNDLSCFKSQLVTGLWDETLTSLLPPIQSCSSKFWAWSCIASNFDKGWRGDHKHKIMDRPFKAKYSTVSQVLLLLVVALFHEYFNA